MYRCSAEGSWTTIRPRLVVSTPARCSVARNRLAASREVPASWARSAWVERTTTSAVGSPGPDDPARVPGLDQLHQDAGDPARDLLERLPRDPRVGLPEPLRQRSEQLHGDLRMLVQQALEVAGEDRHGPHVVDRLDRRRANLAVEHRKLAEDLARAEVRERDRAAVGVLADDPRRAGAQDVAGVAWVSLAQDDRPRRVAPGHGDAGDLFELLRRQLREQRNPAQERDRRFRRRSPRAHPHLQGKYLSAAGWTVHRKEEGRDLAAPAPSPRGGPCRASSCAAGGAPSARRRGRRRR